MNRSWIRLAGGAAVIASSIAPPALAGGGPPYQVNGSGATLFVDFSRFAAATNDWIDCDGDGNWGFYDSDNNGVRDAVDQLAPTNPGSPNLYWIYQYRSVGSVEGFEEFIAFQTCGDLPEVIPSERGVLNTLDWAITGLPNGSASAAGWGPACTDDTDLDGVPNASNTPRCPESIDLANVDVSSLWATRVEPAPPAPVWGLKPGAVGYGDNPRVSRGNPAQSGESNRLASLSRNCAGGGTVSLNTNYDNPDQFTIYDTGIAWSTVLSIANRGSDVWTDANGNGLRDANEEGTIRFRDLQHGYVTGRVRSGENFAFVCRDVGSGTRNAHMNPLGIDPSWGIGDHVGRRINQDLLTRPGPNHQVNNCGSSSISESSVTNRRLAIGYTGSVGPSRAFEDARAGRYELLGTIQDIDGDHDGQPDATQIVRPTLESIVNNCDPNTGFRIGGIQTLVTVGNPRAMALGRVPAIETGPPVANVEAAKFVRNIEESIADFNPPLPPDQFFMPGELLATQFILVAGVPCLPKFNDPTDYVPNPNFNPAIRDYILANNVYRAGGPSEPVQWGDIDAGGQVSPAGEVPRRRAPILAIIEPHQSGNGIANTAAVGDDVQVIGVGQPARAGAVVILPGANGILDSTPAGDDYTNRYRDGGTGAYVYLDAGGNPQTIGTAAGQRLSQRNRVQGDFNNDGRRDINDIERAVDAHHLFLTAATPNAALAGFEGVQGGIAGSMAVDRFVVHISGDMDGDGEFNEADLRYIGDGLAIVPTTRRLNRAAGFTRIDQRWQVLTGSNNLFGTTKATGAPYQPGDSRADVAGNPNGTTPGAAPTGADGVINAADIDYICDNFVADWTDTNLAADRDLSADIDGDLDVDGEDVRVVVEDILGTQFGDANLDGVVDAADEAIVTANLGQPGGWAQGDFDCDGVVTEADLEIITGGGCGAFLRGDADGSGAVNNFDIDAFVLAISNPDAYTAQFCGGDPDCTICRNDLDGSGAVNNFDIDPFVACLNNLPAPGQPCP
jgi:hypothetical protein